MNEIGGYFELELGLHSHFHENSIKINTARNCIKYLIRSQQLKEIYIPAYCCNSIIQAIKEEQIDFSFYHIDQHYEIIDKLPLESHCKILYINYYGIKNEYCLQLAELYKESLLIDNSQAFFTSVIPNIDTIYNARKFFGVPDGAYLYTGTGKNIDLPQDYSKDLFKHLIGRIEISAESHYADFLKSENKIAKKPLKSMSKITDRLLRSIDYSGVKRARESNLNALHSALFEKEISQQKSNFAYLFKTQNPRIREYLIKNKIYVATYWKDALKRCSSVEKDLIQHTIALPIDQRYNQEHMQHIAEVIKNAPK